MIVNGYKIEKSADLRGADLRGTNLRGVNLRGADLQGADLEATDLRGADLSGTNLRGADLQDADLRGTNLRGAYLRGADLIRAAGIMQWQSPLGERRNCYSVKHDNCVMHKLGCFWGNTQEAVVAIREKYGDNSLYEDFLLMQVKALECPAATKLAI